MPLPIDYFRITVEVDPGPDDLSWGALPAIIRAFEGTRIIYTDTEVKMIGLGLNITWERDRVRSLEVQ